MAGDIVMKSIEFEGKSYEDAVEKASVILGIPADHLSIDVIQVRKKIIGFNRKKYRISVSPKPVLDNQVLHHLDKWIDSSVHTGSRDEKSDFFLTGKAWIKSGELIFSANEALQPGITIPEELTMYINNQRAQGSVTLYEGDQIRFTMPYVKQDSEWSVRMDESTQEVFLKIMPGKYLVPFLEDHQPDSDLQLTLGYFEQPDNEVAENMIFDKLHEMNIIFGIDDSAIERACDTHKEGEFLIAKGRPHVDGEDALLDVHVALNHERLLSSEDNEGKIDIRDSLTIPGIRKGEEIARIIEATDGVDGISVTGDVLKASDGAPISIKSSKDIAISENQSILALVPGRPQIEISGNLYRIVIAPKYTHKGDLKPKDGHVRFVGDVEVSGDVTDGMKVSAEGTIFIHNGVYHTTIQARESVIVGKNVISSTVIAGKNSVILNTLGSRLSAFMTDYEAFVNALNQLRHVEEFQTYFLDPSKVGTLVQRVKESRFPAIEQNGKELTALISENQERLESVWMDFRQAIERHFLSFRLQKYFSLEALQEIYHQGKELLAICEAPGSKEADITINYATKSFLEASRDIRVLGKGLLHSTVIAGGHLTCDGKLIGGETDTFSTDLHTVGSPSGVRTILKADADGFIRASLVHPDVIIRVGNRQYFFTHEESMIHARINDQGELLLH
ncbi:flagellar assembly protein A [Salisediminibacterium beveridgei]|uniref:Serine phosphatase RsbU, regulator of sigma subunit n=1 Tax=Salisediminibacterium beveridgei TaxID=632773 RepID=A0A1D7QV80_9BACI|nr:FapA family protein [Salisediminibacterium beveridgei]AOM82924.1 Serine phosphatase RsbU, regulator of sigma subunit [Salisediminibacterium beveridgei]